MTRLCTGLEGLTNATNKLLLKHVDNDTTAATQCSTAAAAIYDAWHSLSTLCNKELSSSHQTSSVALTLVAAKHLLSTMTRSLQSMPVSSAIDCLQSGIAAMYRLVATIEQEQANTVNTESSSSSDTTASTSGSNSQFQWTDGVLVKALEAGHWILLENSNYCSASVLDRLNPLLETGGELLLTECGTTSGKLRVIKPHPNFRLFLTCDPQSGEVSRSMRNRCLEICLLDTVLTTSVINQTAASGDIKLNNKPHVVKNSIIDDSSSAVVTRDSLLDVTAVIHNLGGVMSSSVISVMLDVHRRVTANCTLRGLRLPNTRDLLRWSELLTQQLSRGIVDDAEHIDEITVIMAKAFALAYNGSGGLSIIDNVEAVIHAALQDTVTIENQFTNQLVLVQDCMSDISDIARYRCIQDARLSAYITANQGKRIINTQHNGADTSIASLLSHAVTNIIALCHENSGSAVPITESFAVALSKCVNSATGSDLLPYVLATYARESSTIDRQLRAHYTPTECTAAVSTMLTALYDGTAWKACASVLQTFQDASDTTDTKAAIAFMQSPWAPMTPTTDNDLWVTAQQQLQHPTSNTAHITTTLQKFSIAVASRLPVILSEELCVLQAKQQLQAPRISEQGMSWLTISCLAHFDANKRKKVSGSGDTHTLRTNIVPHFYTLLATTDAILAQCVDIDVVQPSLIAAVTGPRDDLSVLLSTSQPTAATATASTANTSVATVAQFGWDKFIVAWRWYKAAILKVNKILMDTSLHSSINEQLQQSILDIQSLCACIDIGVAEFGGVGTLSNGGDILWKYGQHPSLPANTVHAQALAELHTLSGSYAIAPVSTTDGNSSDSSKSINLVDFLKASHPVLSIPLALRWDLLLVAATLHHAVTDEWSDRSVNTNSVNSTSSNADIQTLLRLPDTLKAATQKAQRLFEETHKGTRLIGNGSSDSTSTGTIGGIEQDAMLAFDSEDQASLAAIAEASIVVIGGSNDGNSSNSGVLDRWAHVQLIPLVQHWAAVEELNIISELVAISNDDTVTSYDSTTELAAVMRRMKQLIKVQIENTLAAPTELRPYQMLVWAYDSATATASSSSSSSVTNSQAVDKLLHVLLPRVLPLMLQSWGDRVSSNLYNDVDAVCSKLEPPSIIPIQSTHDTIGSESATTLQYNGAPRLLQCVRSAVVLKLLQGDVTVMNAPARLRQCQTAISHVLQLSYRGSSTTSGSVQSLQQLAWSRLLHTVQAFEDIFDNSEQYDEAISTLQQCFTSSHTNDVSMSDSAQQQQQQQSLLQQVSVALYKCTNSRLTAVISSLILPAVEALMMSAVGVSTTQQQQQLVHVSTAVALIGVIRLSLLLPSTPVDPGQAPAAKESLLQVRLNSCALDFTAQQLSRYISCGGILSSSMCEQLNEAQRLHSACIALSKRAVVRPSAAAAATSDGNNSQSFRKLFSELHAFGSKVGSIQRVTTLLTALADSSSNSSTDSSKDSIARAVALCQEERVWQDTSHAFINRLHSDYTDFGDITAPICEAITFIRTGLRLLASTLDITTHSTTGTDTDEATITKNNLIKFLLQYPYTPSSTGNVTDIHAEMHETQAVVSGSDRVKKVAVLQAVLSRAELYMVSNVIDGSEALTIAGDVMQTMVQAWRQQDKEDDERRHKEAQSLEYKTKSHEVLDEQAQEDARMYELFPDFHGDYADIVGAKRFEELGDGPTEPINNTSITSQQTATVDSIRLSDDQIATLAATHWRMTMLQLHRLINQEDATLQGTTKGITNTVQSQQLDAYRLVAFNTAYRAASLYRSDINVMASSSSDSSAIGDDSNSNLESSFTSSHLLAMANAVKLCIQGTSLLDNATATNDTTTTATALHSPTPKAVATRLTLHSAANDFYRDAAPHETRRCDTPLATLLLRCTALLQQFPGNAVVAQVARVADRIRRMPLQSPLASALVGIELALKQAQEWEAGAHRLVSMQQELQPLSALVVRWRKMELDSWGGMLQLRETKAVNKALTWWVRLHSIINGTETSSTTDLTATTAPELTDEDANDTAVLKIIDAMKQKPDKRVVYGDVMKDTSITFDVQWPSDGIKLVPGWLWRGVIDVKLGTVSFVEYKIVVHSQ
eukprot:12483-Heterococcus_DN1.PRE.2